MVKNLLFNSKKLKAALAAAMFLIVSERYSAQIVYQDITDVVSPQPTQYTSIYNVDFDSNFQNDATFEWTQQGTEWIVNLDTFFGNKVVSTPESNGARKVTPLALNTNINSSSSLGTASDVFQKNHLNDFLDQGDKYIGYELRKQNQNYYGWILVNFSTVNNVKTITIKSFAYNSTPGEPILAGQTSSLGVDDISRQDNFSIYPNPAKNTIYLKDDKKSGISSFRIFNSAGQLVKQDEENTNSNIDVSALSKGVYYLQVTDKETLKPKNIKFIKE